MIRKAIIILLSFATCVTGGLWVLSHLEWPGRWNAQAFGVKLKHSLIFYPGWQVSRNIPEPLELHMVRIYDGHIQFLRYQEPTQIEWKPYEWGIGRLYISRSLSIAMSGWAGVDIGVPIWLPFTLFATYPAVAFIRGPLRRYRRLRRGWCIHCGYDLTGNVTGVCSECGEAI